MRAGKSSYMVLSSTILISSIGCRARDLPGRDSRAVQQRAAVVQQPSPAEEDGLPRAQPGAADGRATAARGAEQQLEEGSCHRGAEAHRAQRAHYVARGSPTRQSGEAHDCESQVRRVFFMGRHHLSLFLSKRSHIHSVRLSQAGASPRVPLSYFPSLSLSPVTQETIEY